MDSPEPLLGGDEIEGVGWQPRKKISVFEWDGWWFGDFQAIS